MAGKKKTPKTKKSQHKPDGKPANSSDKRPEPAGQNISLIKFDRYQALFLSILVLVGAIIYANSLQVPFVFDDINAVIDNPSIRMEEISVENMIDAATGWGKSRPFPMISFGFNYYFGQFNVRGYHLVNVFIHMVNGILVFFLVKLTLTLVNRRDCEERRFAPITVVTLSFTTALLWLVNPVQTQAVTYIVQRMTSMGAMFYLLALFLYARGRIAQLKTDRQDHGGSKHHYFWFAGCLAAGLLALASKESTAMLPIFIFLYEWYFFQDLDKTWLRRQLKYLAAIAILFALIAGLYLGFDPQGTISTFRDYAYREFSVGQRLLTQTRVVVYYVSLIFYPSPSRLNLDYDFPLSYSLFNPFTTLISLVIIAALLGLGFYLAKKNRLLSFCILWFLGNLVIESSVIPLALIFEHRIYLPSVFVFLAIVILFHRFIKPAWLPAAIACAAVMVCSYWTYERNKIWQDDLVLWQDCNRKSPNKARPYINMGQILTKRDRYDEALTNLLKAVEIRPYFMDAHYNLGVLFEKRDDPDKAIEHYRKAVALDPDFAKAHNNLGVALLKQDMPEEAVIHFQKALNKEPNMAAAHLNMGLALSNLDKLSDAVVHFEKALQVNSNLPKAQFQLGAALVKQGHTNKGKHHIQRALEIDPEFGEAHNNLGGQLLQEGKIDEALEHFNAALKSDPEIAEAHNNVGIIMIHKGKINEAVFHFREAVRINPEFELARDNLREAVAIQQSQMDAEMNKIQEALKYNPDDPQLNYELGNLYLARGEPDRAIERFQKTLAVQPHFAPALNNLALAHTFAGQYDRALEVFLQLIALQPENAATYYNVAVLYALQDNETEALNWLKKAVGKGYDNWDLIKTDRDLESIRDSEGYRELIEGR